MDNTGLLVFNIIQVGNGLRAFLKINNQKTVSLLSQRNSQCLTDIPSTTDDSNSRSAHTLKKVRKKGVLTADLLPTALNII